MDVKQKLIRKFHVTSAEVHDSQVVEELQDDNNTNRELLADLAYRSQIEHVFGVQSQRAGNLLLRGVGLARAEARIGLRNLAYNLDRYGTLALA